MSPIRLVLVALALSLAVCSPAYVAAEQSAAETLAAPAGKYFDRMFVIIFENHGFKQVVANPIWRKLIDQSRLFTNYFGVTHPSQPNYIAQLGGDLLVHDNNDYNLNETNLVDLLEAKGVSWRTYQEAYIPMADGGCNHATTIGRYVRKHNPFVSFTSISKNITRCRNIVPLTQLEEDVRLNRLPQLSYLTPDMDSSAHDTDLDHAGKWLQAFLDKYLNEKNFIENTLLLITWDEDEYLENNRVATFMMGPYIKPGTSHNGRFDHFSWTRSVELNWGLGHLGRKDATAADFLDAIQG